MIGFLKGIIVSIELDSIILDVNGVGYLLYCPAKTLSSFTENDKATFFVTTVVKEDSITLFGFTNAEDKKWFTNLQSVQGVGPRMALAILSAMDGNDIVTAIVSEDASQFKKISGVGPKLAARIINELKDKKSIVSIPISKVAIASTSDFSSDAVSALINLGFARKDAFFAVKNIIAENDNIDLEETIRLALAKLTA